MGRKEVAFVYLLFKQIIAEVFTELEAKLKEQSMKEKFHLKFFSWKHRYGQGTLNRFKAVCYRKIGPLQKLTLFEVSCDYVDGKINVNEIKNSFSLFLNKNKINEQISVDIDIIEYLEFLFNKKRKDIETSLSQGNTGPTRRLRYFTVHDVDHKPFWYISSLRG